MSNNREFLLKHTFVGFKMDAENMKTQTMYTANIPWVVCLHWDDAGLYVAIECGKETSSNMWSIDVKMQIFYGRDTSTLPRGEEEPVTFQFSEKAGEYEIRSKVATNEKIESWMCNGNFLFECKMEIVHFTGITLKRKLSFESPLENLSDVLLKVEDKSFHVSKVILATHSPYFKSMFFGDFGEANKNEVVLKDIKAVTFDQYLSFLYRAEPPITDKNVAELVTMADLFGTSFIVEACEKFLTRTSKKKMVEKLQLAEKFRMIELHGKCLDALSSKESIKNVCKEVDVLGEFTVKALLKKLIRY